MLGVPVIFIHKTLSVKIDVIPSKTDRRKGQQRSMRMSHRAVGLVGPHVLQFRAKRLTPENAFPCVSLVAKVVSVLHFRNVPGEHAPVGTETVERKDGFPGPRQISAYPLNLHFSTEHGP